MLTISFKAPDLSKLMKEHGAEDKNLVNALTVHHRLGDKAEPAERIKNLQTIMKLSADLAKKQKQAKELAQELADLAKEAEQLKKQIESEAQSDAKRKAEEEKKAKQAKEQAEAKEKAKEKEKEAKEKEEEGGDDDQVGDLLGAGLEAALKKLRSSKGTKLEYLVCAAKPVYGVLIAKKIAPKHKQQLQDLTGGKKFFPPGDCSFEDGKFSFMSDKVPPGLAKNLQKSLKFYVGKNIPLQVVDAATGNALNADDDSDAAEEPEEETGQGSVESTAGGKGGRPTPPRPEELETPPRREPTPPPAVSVEPAAPAGGGGQATDVGATRPLEISASVGAGGRNKPEDVTQVQLALNDKNGAGLVADGKCGPKTIAAIKAFQKTMGFGAPDGRVDPGKYTEKALRGEKVDLPPDVKEGKSGGAKGGAGGGKGGGKVSPEEAKRMEEAAKKQMAAAQKAVQEVLKRMGKVFSGGNRPPTPAERIKKELEEGFDDVKEHAGKIADAVGDYVKDKSPKSWEAAKKAAEAAEAAHDAVTEAARDAAKWLAEQAKEAGVGKPFDADAGGTGKQG